MIVDYFKHMKIIKSSKFPWENSPESRRHPTSMKTLRQLSTPSEAALDAEDALKHHFNGRSCYGPKEGHNSQLVGGAITILKNMRVNGKDYPIYYGK